MTELDMKTFGALEIKDEAKGEVIAVVATLGAVDRDGDVILPGAFPSGGSRVKLSGYGHDTILDNAPPVGKGMITEEHGKAMFRGNFFLSTYRGREAFLTTKEVGPDGEWSFGFPRAVELGELTPEWEAKGARRVIRGLLPLEASPVFRGAGVGTGTVLVKEAAANESSNTATLEPTVLAEPETPAPDPAAAELEIKAQRERAEKAVEEYRQVRRSLKRLGLIL